MESLPDRSSSSESRTPAERPKGGKVARIATHTQNLVEDLREWIDLRLDLAVLDLEEKVDTAKNQAALGVVLAIMGFFFGLFFLMTAAIGIGWALGHPFWGYLIVTGVLGLVLAVFVKAKPELTPPSKLFEKIRGDDEPDEDDDLPPRDAKATVEDAPSS